MKLHITFESDWHIGEGAAASGHIDRVVRRHPQDGLPYVPAKTLTGLLRDACERVAHGLDEGEPVGAWQDFVASLFGRQSSGVDDPATTTTSLIRISEGRFAQGLRDALHDSAEFKAALTFVKPGIALDEEGMAKSNMLRMEEVSIAGGELEAAIELDDALSQESNQPALTLLAAACRAVERIGAKRRRGSGRCTLWLEGAREDWTLLDRPAPPEVTLPGSTRRLRLSGIDTKSAGSWHVIPLDLILQSPVVVPAGTAGNVIESRDHIPGSLLLPALDKKLRTLLGDRAADLTSLLAAGHVRVHNAYLLSRTQRLLPAPAALMAEKDRPGIIFNELYEHLDDGVQRKQLRGGYVPPTSLPDEGHQKSAVQTVNMIAATHAVIDDRVQRPTQDVGGVYTYEAIGPGQLFRSELWINDSVLAQLPQNLGLDGVIRIGRAKKDDYGRVRIEARKPEVASIATPVGDTFTLWLASPLLARDERLRPITDASAFTNWLNRQLGTSLSCMRAFVRSMRDDGWNNAWNEPRSTRFGLAAGSCFLFKGAVDTARLNALVMQGLGERCGEGYGEVVLEAPLLAAKEVARHVAEPLQADSPERALSASGFVIQLHQRVWRTALRRQALAQADKQAQALGWMNGKPGNSQLGALRSQFENWKGAASFKAWLKHLNETPNRKDKWPVKSLDIMGQQAAADDFVWQHFKDLPQLGDPDVIVKVKGQLQSEATPIYWLTVIGAELDRRANEERKAAKKEEC